MRILVVTNMYPSGERPVDGVFVQREVEALRAASADISIEVAHVDTVGLRWRYLTGPFAIAAAVRSFKPDLVHIHYGLTQLVCPGWFGPRVVTFHGSDLTLRWQRAISVSLAALAHAHPVVVSGRLLGALPRSLRDRSVVIGCGVDPRFRSTALAARPHQRPGRIRIGFPASPQRPGKDYALFSLVLTQLREDGIEVEEVILEGFEPLLMPEALASLDVLLMTSLHEGSPVVTREAMCCGVRVVSVDVGDIAEQLAGMGGCVVVGTRRASDVASAVRESLRQTGPNPTVAFERFSVSREAHALIDRYRQILGSL